MSRGKQLQEMESASTPGQGGVQEVVQNNPELL
jgi:hypothetical protein